MTDDTAPTATATTRYRDPPTAAVVAGAVRPDNTGDVTTRVDGATVRTEVRRGSVGGLSSSVDDYVVNLGVAAAVVEAVDGRPPDATGDTDDARRRATDDSEQTADDSQRTTDDSQQTADDTRHHE
jgi:hypothetical protein